MSATHVVADALNTFTFDCQMPFAPVAQELNRVFRIAPITLDDLVNVFCGLRPDLLIGRIDRTGSQLRVIAGATGLDPRTSSIIKYAVELLCLGQCWRCLVVEHNEKDAWVTTHAEMFGGVPPALFHGTSDAYLAPIRAADY